MFVKKTIPKSEDEIEKLKYSSNSDDDNWDSDTIDSILNSSRSYSKKGIHIYIIIIYFIKLLKFDMYFYFY